MTDLEHRIRDRAHQLWVENGSPDNMAEHFWLLAERQIAEESAAGMTAPLPEQAVPGQLEEDITGRESGRAQQRAQKNSIDRKSPSALSK